RLGQALREVAPWGGPVLTGFYSALALRDLDKGLFHYLPVRVSLKPLDAAIPANQETVSKKTGRTIRTADCCHDCIRTFFDPMTNVVRFKSYFFRGQSGRGGCNWRA